MLVGLTRVRNESLIIEDTLKHALQWCERVYLYDDASTDNTAEIAASFDRVTVTHGEDWRADRPAEETRHRALLLDQARGADWVWCFDADERLTGDWPDLTADAYRFRLFDGYMAEGHEPYTGGQLVDLPRLWGPEHRDIIMLFRPGAATYAGRDKREPAINGRTELAPMNVKHYGKCLSVEHWEETCDYYANHWPEPYRSKWAARRGQAIHQLSDFGKPLYQWGELCLAS